MLDEDGSCYDTGMSDVIADTLSFCRESPLILGEGYFTQLLLQGEDEMDEFMVGAIFGAIIVGALVGAIPAIAGAIKGKIGLAIGGFFACLVSSLILGLILSVPVCALFMFLIFKDAKAG